MLFSEIKADVYRKMGWPSSPDSTTVTRVEANINETHREILSDPICSRLRRVVDVSFSTVANSPYAVLPIGATRIYGIRDQTNQQDLDIMPIRTMNEMDPGRNYTSATPEGYDVLNYSSPVSRQPSDSSQLLVDSTAAGDTNTAYLESLQNGGYPRSSSAVMTGITAVNIGPSDVIRVLDFYLSAVAVGVVTLTEDTEGGTVLSQINIGQTRSRYCLIRIYPTPASVFTLYADCDIRIPTMANANAEPILPDDFHSMLSIGARRKEWEKREKGIPKSLEMEWAQWLGKLHLEMHRGAGSKAGGDGYRRWSQLGAYFPPGS
jgi:hypothetical protein